jgi:hypothetical protein
MTNWSWDTRETTMTKSIAEEMHDWLLYPVSSQEAEACHTYAGVPFGLENANWNVLRSKVLADPELQLWSFRSPSETWSTFPCRGWEGYATVKDGKITDFLLTSIS